MVRPWRRGTGNWPTNDSKPGRSIGPSTAAPPTGFGRSQTTTGMSAAAHACRQLVIVWT